MVAFFLREREGISLNSHRLAPSFRTDSGPSFGLEISLATAEFTTKGGDLVPIFHVGTGVLDPFFLPIKIALLSRYLRTRDDDDDDEQALFLILQLAFDFPSMEMLNPL